MLVQQKRRGHERHGGGMAKHFPTLAGSMDGVDNYNSTFNPPPPPRGQIHLSEISQYIMMYICQPLQTSSGL